MHGVFFNLYGEDIQIWGKLLMMRMKCNLFFESKAIDAGPCGWMMIIPIRVYGGTIYRSYLHHLEAFNCGETLRCAFAIVYSPPLKYDHY
jgi:hypothetical protein